MMSEGLMQLCCDWTVSEHQRMCEERLAPLLSPSESLSDEDAVKLGKKEPEQEVTHTHTEAFVLLSLCGLVSKTCIVRTFWQVFTSEGVVKPKYLIGPLVEAISHPPLHVGGQDIVQILNPKCT